MLHRTGIITAISLLCLLVFSAIWAYNKQYESMIPRFSIEKNPMSKSHSENAIMGPMGNETQKEELGQATWKFLHTMMARYPENPLSEEKKTLHDFMMLFSTLYPCGECATHFNKLITTYPPQTSSRMAASQWLCAMHNKVNERLHKPIFDCNDIESKYPCGCSIDG